MGQNIMYTHPPQTFSYNHEATNQGYTYITNIYTNNQFCGKMGKWTKDGYYSKQALKHQPRMDIRSQSLSPTM